MPRPPQRVVGDLGHLSDHNAIHGTAAFLDTVGDWTADQRFASGRPWVDVTAAPFGAVGDGVTDSTAALDAAVAYAASLGVWVTVFVPYGDFLTDGLLVPARVSLCGSGRESSRLVNRDTGGNNFVTVAGSQVTVEDLTIDGQRDIQTNASGGALVIAKPNGAGGLAGGMTLSGAVAPGATSFNVASSSFGGQPLLPGDVVTFLEGAVLELVRVSRTYAGGLSVPVDRPFLNAFTVAATVTAAATNVTVRNVLALGCGNAGITLWHGIDCLIVDNYARDCFDAGIDLPDAGSRHCVIRNNQIESDGRFGIALDTASAGFGRTSHCSVVGNQVRLLNGADNRYGIWLGSVNDILVDGNVIDLLKGGLGGVRLDQDAYHVTCNANHIYGRAVADTAGISVVNSVPNSDRRSVYSANIIRDFDIGIDLQNSLTATVVGNQIFNCLNYGVNVLAQVAGVQEIAVTGNLIDTVTVGIRAGGTPAAGGKLRARENVVANESFASTVADAGWILQDDLHPAVIADTSGATLGALEVEVNALKAQMRIFGVLNP